MSQKPKKEPVSKGFVDGIWPTEVRQQAYDLYMSYMPIRKIGPEIGIPEGTIREWIYQLGWNKHRSAITEAAKQEFAEKRQGQLLQISADGLDIIAKEIKALRVKGGLSLKELSQLATLITDFDKLQRLAAGQATEIKESRGISIQLPSKSTSAIKQVFAEDPLLASSDDVIEPELITDES